MPALGKRQAIFIGEEIARYIEVAAVVAPGQAQLSRRIRGGAAAHDERAERAPAEKTWQAGRGSTRRRLSGEKIGRSRKPDPCRVEKVRREDMGFLEACHLLAESLRVRAEEIRTGRREVGAVVNRVNPVERIPGRDNVVEPHGPEVVTDRL